MGLFFFNEIGHAQKISDHFFGENAWMPDTIGNVQACKEPPCILNGKLHSQWGNIKNSGTSIVRFGGIAADRNMPTNHQYIRMIDSIRASGMEPILQVPFCNYRYTAQQAADIVKFINVTQGKKIKYWIIANEPDLGYSYSSASQIAKYFKPFATAMKAIDPSILIIGPELSSFNQTIMDGLTTPNGPDDITGKDQNGNFYLDVISFHTYPFNGSQTRDNVVTKLMSPFNLNDNLVYLNARVAACNAAHQRGGASVLKTAITEANINWQNSASDNLTGNGANSFVGGQFIAEMLCIGMKNNVDFINMWSVVEGNSTASNIGFIDATNYNKKPAYFHFKLLAENFRGNFLSGITNQAHVKSFGSKDEYETSVLILNEDQTNGYDYTVRLNNDKVAISTGLTVNVDAGINKEYTGKMASQSSVLLVFNPAGEIVRKYEYSLQDNALANLPPTYTEYAASVVPPKVVGNKVVTNAVATNIEVVSGVFGIKTFPNPSNGKFTIQLNFGNADPKKIQIINTLGQDVFNETSDFVDGKEDVELQEDLAVGAYILRVTEGKNVSTQKIIIN